MERSGGTYQRAGDGVPLRPLLITVTPTLAAYFSFLYSANTTRAKHKIAIRSGKQEGKRNLPITFLMWYNVHCNVSHIATASSHPPRND